MVWGAYPCLQALTVDLFADMDETGDFEGSGFFYFEISDMKNVAFGNSKNCCLRNCVLDLKYVYFSRNEYNNL